MSTSGVSMQMESMTGLEIAVIGMAGKFPGARTIDEFWDNLKNGVESISFFSDEEFIKSRIAPTQIKDANFVKAGGVLPEDIVESFDSYFFDYFPKEAEKMDPQVRIFHECAWEALEHAGYNPESYPGLIGVYAGASSNFIWEVLSYFHGASGEADLDPFDVFLLADRDFLSSHVSYKLDLKGPVVTLQTACSTSLAAIHQASRALLTGECDMALAGGVTIRIPQRRGYRYKQGMIHSPDGHCRAFDAKAKGTVGGDGIGIVVLKRLNNALRDRDNIQAVIKGSAMNNDGNRKVGYTAPSVEGQVELIKAALKMAEIDPGTIGYLETHGTGTTLGDPVELEALKLAFNTGKKGFCRIGSIKTNMGHLDSAAGVASFIKTVLVLKYKLIPPSLHFENPNPKIDFENSAFRVNTQLTPWKNNEYPRRAGVSSLGIGGTNVHVILEEAPTAQSAKRSAHSEECTAHGLQGQSREGVSLPDNWSPYQLILLSAKTETALEKMTRSLADYFKRNPYINMADVAYTLQQGRATFQYRKMLVCSTIDEAVETLSSAGSPGIHTAVVKEENRTVVFMFPGQGAQYVNMGLELYRTEPVFREEMNRCFEILRPIMDYDIKEVLYPHPDCRGGSPCPPQDCVGSPGQGDHSGSPLQSDRINQTAITQPLMFIFEYALAKLLMKWGIEPHAMIGHSIGEYTAACLSGVFSLDDALRLVVLRGKLMQQMPTGSMLTVSLSEDRLNPLLALNDEISLAASNSPTHCVVSGLHEAIDHFARQLKEKGYESKPIHTSHAFHSRMMEPILKEFAREVGKVVLNQPRIPYISNVTGKWITIEDAVDPGYWAKHIRQPVRFSSGLEELLKEPPAVFLEIGPGTGLSTFIKKYEDNQSGLLAVNLVRHPLDHTPDDRYLLTKIGLLWLYGITVNWSEFHGRDARNRIPLPTYPFEPERYRVDEGILKKIKNSSWQPVNTAHPLPGKKPEIRDWFYVPLWEKSLLSLEKQKSSAPPPAINWLVFVEPGDFGSKFIEMLAPHAGNIIRVSPGPAFAWKSQQEYTINPQQENDYHRLFLELRTRDALPRIIVHCWGVGGDHNGPTGFAGIDRIREKGFYSLLYIARAVGKQGISSDIKIDVITDNMQDVTGTEVLNPAKALLLGAVKVIPREYPHIRCRSIDIERPQNGSLAREVCWPRLLRELMNDSSHQVIALRGRHRWTPVIKAVSFYTAVQPGEGLRENGVYLITGGLGGIGLTLALYLARHVKARLILTSRSAFPPGNEWEQRLSDTYTSSPLRSKIRKLLEMKKCGSQVMVLSADVSNPVQMKHIVASSEKRFGPINGVIHAAGVPDDGLIQARTLEITGSVFKAKVKGTLVLEKIFQDKPLDFFILCSSLAFIQGPLGSAAYIAANAFQDAFAQYKAQNNGQWNSIVTINWDTWQQVGRTGPDLPTANEINPDQQLEHGLLPEESSEIFQRIIGIQQLQIPQVVISIHDFMSGTAVGDTRQQPAAPRKKEETAPGKSTTSLRSRHGMSKPYASPTNQIEKELVQIWQNFLGITQIGIYDDFFELGGDSLKAITLTSKIHKNHDVEIPVREFFNHPTIQEIAGYISNAKKSVYARIESVEKKEYYALSSVQKRIYILQQMESGNISYNISQIIPLAEAIEPIKLENTFKKLITRHDSLRTSFEMIAETLVQRIHQEVDFAIEYYEARKNEGGNISNRFTRPFDLSQPPLLRVGMEKTVSSPPLLLVDMHHIITDHISQIVLQREFLSLYRDEKLLPLRLQYKDYAHWHNSEKQQILIKQQEEYWINMFSNNDQIPVLNLPTDYSRPLRQSFEGSSVSFVLTGNEPQALKALSKEVNTTLFMTILSIFTILLSKLSDQEDIIVGVPIAARRHADLENIIGMFANTLAIRNYPSGEKSFREFLIQVKERTLKGYENQEYPFEALVENVSIQRDISRNPVFDVMFNLLILSESSDSVDIPGVDVQKSDEYVHRKRTSKFDLNLTAVDKNGKSLYFDFEYCTKLFKARTIERIIGYFRRIIALLSVNPELKLADLEILTKEEKAKVLEISRGVEEALDIDQTIHRWFEDQAVKSPDSIALVMNGLDKETPVTSFLSYRELNERANQLATELMSRGVTTDIVVGLMIERSFEMIIGILAIMKAGGAYMPVDIEYPKARKEYMLKDSEIKLLLTNYRIEERYDFIPNDLQVIDINDQGLYGGDEIKPVHIDNINSGSDLVYVIYTSGSTGNPKGVMLEHPNLVNLLTFQFNYTNIDCSRVLQFATISFDASFHETFSALLSGGVLYLINRELRGNIPGLFSYIEKNDIKTLFLPMSLLRTVFCEDEFVAIFPRCVDHIQTAGEQVIISDKLRGYLKVNHVYLHNHYGPSETHVVTTLTLDPAEEIPDIPPIGKPILNTSIFILDKKHHLLPPGIPGELYIGGIQVGRGYQGKMQLTVERFIVSPFAQGERLYKSGDLARWLLDGNIEFLGRIDHQVKIRGFRVELGEIENRLLAHEKIKEAVVIAKEQSLPNGTGEKYLSAYISTERQPQDTHHLEITSSELRDYLLRSLPDYMIPSYFVQIDSIPLTPNGKVDRKALALHGIPMDSGIPFTAPQNDVEKKIVEVWKEVLHLEKVGIHDNYFELGGDSLKAITIISRVHRVLNVEIPLVEFFNRPTIEQLAQYIENAETSNYRSIRSVEKKEYYVLSSAQVRLYVLQIIERESVGYNEPLIRILEGNLDQDRIGEVFNRLLRRHECLRTSIEMINSEPVQRVHDPSSLEFMVAFYEADENKVRELITAFVKPFDMAKAPFLRVGLIKVGETRHVLIIDMHHIVTDGVSYEIFIKEALHFYNGEELPALRLQYKDYAEWQKSVTMKRQQEYWLGQFNGAPRPLDLSADYPRPPVRSFEGDRVTGVIGSELTANLREIAHKKGATDSIIFLALFNVLLAKYTDREDIIVGMLVTGRRHSDLEPIIGMFVNMLAMRNYPSFKRSFIDFLEEVKEFSVNAYENQEYPFDTLVGQLKVNREAARNPLFDVVYQFNTIEPSNRDNRDKKFENIDIKPFKMNSEVAKFDLILSVDDNIKTMAFSFYYWSKLFKRETIENMSRHFENIVKEVVKDPGIKISAIKMLTEEVNKKKPGKVIAEFNLD